MTNKSPNLVMRLVGSGFVWLLLFLIGLNVVFAYCDPLKWMGDTEDPSRLVQGAVKYKAHAIESMKQAPDIALIGSSLPMSAAYYSDCKYHESEMNDWIKSCNSQRISAFQAYAGARYFEDSLAKACARPVRVFNLTSAACMASDAYLLLSRAIEKQPDIKTVVYGVAPRDFMDNLVPELGMTPAFEALSSPSTIGAVVGKETRPTTAFEISMRSLCSFYRERNNLHDLLLSGPSAFFNREITLAKAVAKAENHGAAFEAGLPVLPTKPASASSASVVRWVKEKPAHIYPKAMATHLKDYNCRYNPPNEKRFDQELLQFRKILALCKERHIQLFVVNMPITGANKQMIDHAMMSRYQSAVSTLPAEYGATYINLDAVTYDPQNDYLDSVHLNECGGPKVLDRLVQEIRPKLICKSSL